MFKNPKYLFKKKQIETSNEYLICIPIVNKKKEIIMPTVKYKCGDTGKMKKKVFPYNSVGKAQAKTFSDLMNGKIKNNPNRKMPGY